MPKRTKVSQIASKCVVRGVPFIGQYFFVNDIYIHNIVVIDYPNTPETGAETLTGCPQNATECPYTHANY